MWEPTEEYLRETARIRAMLAEDMVMTDEQLRAHIGGGDSPDYQAARYTSVSEDRPQPFVMLGSVTYWYRHDEALWRGYGM